MLGTAAVAILPYTFALYGAPALIAVALAVLATIPRPRLAGAAGFLLPVGAGWLAVLQQGVDQCAAVNRQPQSSCQMGDNSLLVWLGVALLGTGCVLTAMLLFSSKRHPEGAT